MMLCIAGVLRYDRGEMPWTSQKIISFSNGSGSNAPKSTDLSFLTDYTEAQLLASQQEKPLLLLFTTRNCVFSNRMIETTFRFPSVQPLLKQFVLVKVDLNENPGLWQEFKVESSPTIQFISSKGILLQRLNGETKPEQLTASLNATLHTISARRPGSVLR